MSLMVVLLALTALASSSAAAGRKHGPAVVFDGAAAFYPRPPHEEGAQMSRWLAHSLVWGSLATTTSDGAPVGGILSHSDGAEGNPMGRLFFYMTSMDELSHNLESNPAASFTLTEAQMPQGCEQDPEDPTCAKAAFLGRMVKVTEEDVPMAQNAMFARHPRMAQWPAGHHFEMYELLVKEVHLLDFYGGMKIISDQQYYSAQLAPAVGVL